MDCCKIFEPELTKVGQGHYAACWLTVPEADRPKVVREPEVQA
jgi:hypothetical protein